MEEEALKIPKKFHLQFQKEIRQAYPLAQVDQEISYFDEIYLNSINHDRKNEIIQSKLAEIGLSDQKNMKTVLDWLKEMQQFFSRFNEIVQNQKLGDVSQFPQQKVLDWKFEIFLHKKYLTNKSMTELLDNFNLGIQDTKNFYVKVSELNNITQFKDFKTKITPLLNQLTDIQDMNPEKHDSIFRALYQRNLCLQQIRSTNIENLLQNETLEISLDFVYGNIDKLDIVTENPPQSSIESEEQFCSRVTVLLSSISLKFKDWIVKKRNELISTLYQQNPKQNYNDIVAILLNSKLKEFNSKQLITDQIVIKIYNLPSTTLLDKSQPENKFSEHILNSPSKLESYGSKDVKSLEKKPIKNDQSSSNLKKQETRVSTKEKFGKQFPILPNETQSQNESVQCNNKDQHQNQQHIVTQLEHEIKTIQKLTKGKQCIEIILRQLQIALRDKNPVKIREKADKLREMINKYSLKTNSFTDIDEVQEQVNSFQERIPKISVIRKKLYFLNLLEVFEGKRSIESKSAQLCKGADAILIIGRTGAGKSTLLTAQAGYKLIYAKQSQDFRAQNPKIASKISISNRQQSQTRYANVIEVAKSFTNGDKVVGIDTPGFQQTRGEEMDITNNLATKNLIKVLSSARILIVLPKEQFYGARQLLNYIKFIKLFAAYFFNVNYFESSLDIVLSKGLTAKQLLKTIEDIEKTKTFSQTSWNSNEKNFQKILKKKLKQMKRCNEIVDPSTHDFEEMMRGVMDLGQKQCPGDEICASFSSDSLTAIKQTFVYLEKMVIQTFQQGQFSLTQFYLNNIKQLDEVNNEAHYLQIKNQLKNLLKHKVKQFETTLSKFLSSNSDQLLSQLKRLYNYFNQTDLEHIYSILYEEKNITPKNTSMNAIQESIRNAKQSLKNSEEMDSNRKMQVRSALKLMRQLGYQNDYQQIKNEIQSTKITLHKKIEDILDQNEFIKDNWDSNALLLINQFKQNQDSTNHEVEKFVQIKEIIIKYMNKNNQLDQIMKLKDQAMKQCLDGKLQKICKQYLGKLNAIKQTHYSVKELIQPQFNQIIHELDKLIVTFEEKRSENQNISIADFQMWENYNQNLEEVFSIKSQFANSQIHQFTGLKQQESMLKLFFNNLAQNIDTLQKIIIDLPKNPQHINPELIHEKLELIFGLLEAMQKKVQTKNEQGTEAKMDRRSKKLEQTVKNSYRKINAIISSIERTCNIESVRNYELNVKLLNSLTVVLQFKEFIDKSSTQDMKTKIQALEKNIISKMESPLTSISQQKFQVPFAYQKLWKIQGYMKNLDIQTRNLGGKAINFGYMIDFSNNPKINKVLETCLDKIKSEYQRLSPIKQLSNFGVKETLKSEKSSLTAKSTHIDQLQYDLLEVGVRYVKSYQYVKKITEDFSNDLMVVQDFKREHSINLDLKSTVVSRIQGISMELKRELSLKQIREIKMEFTFFNKIYQNTKSTDQLNFNEIEERILQKLKRFGQNFDTLYDEACETYKDVSNDNQGVQYENLMDLMKHPGITVGDCQDKLRKLLVKIENQYTKLLTNFYINEDPKGEVSQNTNIFLNIFEFKEICKQFKQTFKLQDYECNLKSDLFQSGLQSLFSQLHNGFQNILDQLQKGIPPAEKQVKKLIRYEKKIALLMKKQYDEFKKKKGTTENYFMSFENKIKENKQKFIEKFSNQQKLVFDQNFLNVFHSTTPHNQEVIKSVALKKNKEEILSKQKLVECDHQQVFKFFNKKSEESKNMPPQISQAMWQMLLPLKYKIQEMESKNKQEVETAVEKKNPTKIIVCFLNADSFNNDQMRMKAVQGVKNYFIEQEKVLDCNDLETFEKSLERNFELTSKQEFKTASQKEKQFDIASMNFLKTAKLKVQTKTKDLQKEIQEFTAFAKKKLESQTFHISKTKLDSKDKSIIQKLSGLYNVISKHPQELKEQISKFKQQIEERVNQNNRQLKNSNDKLDLVRKQILEKKDISLSETINIIKQSSSTRETCNAFSELDMMDQPVRNQSKQEVSQHERILKEIGNDLKAKYEEVMNWNLEQFIDKENVISNSKENQQNERNLIVIENLMQMFFDKSEIPVNMRTQIQKKTKVQFEKFENSVQQDIDLFFKASVQCSSEKVMKYYKLVNKIKQSKSLRFSPDMKVDNKVKDKLIKKFKLNTQQIVHFIEKEQKLTKYQSILHQISKIEEKEKQKTEKLQRESAINLQEELNKIQQKSESEKKTVADDDPDRSSKLAKIEDQCKGDKLSKENDLKKKLQENIEKEKKSLSKAKDQLSVELNSFLEQNIINPLIIFQRANTYFYCEKQIKDSGYSVDSVCSEIQKKYKKKIFRYLYSILKNSESTHAQALTQKKCFESIDKSKWKQLVKGSTFETLMQKIPHLQEISKDSKFFQERYKKFEAIYQQLTQEYKKSSDYNQTKIKFVNDTKIMGDKISQGYNQESTCKHFRWQLVARIAAIWTIQKSELDDDNNIEFIHKPHPGQILAIFLLLQFDDKKISKKIKKTMVQVSTGEGKSVILGILSTYLALVGFEVYQACYSSYLSERDYNDFAELFELFGVKNKISYKTFPEICKMMLDQSPEKSFVSKVQKLLINPSIWGNIGNFLSGIFPKDKKQKKILLIDEVDAFMDEKYLGQSFFPSINIRKQSVQHLLTFVWNQRSRISQLTPQDITKSKQFDAFCKEIQNSQFKKLMQNQTHAMVRDLGNYKDDVYTLIDGQIYYKSGDSLTNKIHYGYRTVFNYYHEFYVNKRITESQFKKQISINLIIASFSYTMLPSYFSSILGVTGTLQCMSQKQRKILSKRFGVERTFVQPSIYPPNRRKVEFVKCPEDKILQQIALNIKEQHNKKRPIAVFFQSKNEVYHFYNSKQFDEFKSNATIITHEVSAEDRTFRIDTSTSDGKITLLTIDFSRGTDFKLNAKDIDNHPGLHVICACLPRSYSDYLQLAGRTGRQGKNGTVKIFINDFTSNVIEEVNQDVAEKMISDLDDSHWDGKYKQLTERMDKADRQHKESTQLYSKGSNADKIFQKMLTFNLEHPILKIVSRTVVSIDATGSMGHVFSQLIYVIQNSLPIIYEVIDEANVLGTFEVKWVIYRNYNSSAEDLLQYSNFQSKCETLVSWLKEIKVSGGWGNQALQVCFQHINTLQNVNQYVVISDAKGNHPDEVMPKRQQGKGDSYFTQKGFPKTTAKEEIQKLNQKKIKGHFYYLNSSSTKDYYHKVSQETGGVAEEFKINEKNSIKLFSDFIAERILTNLGELVGGNNAQLLVQKYKARSSE